RWRTISESTLSCFTDPTASILATFTTDLRLSGGWSDHTPANNIGSAPTMNSFMQSPNIDYNMFMNQLSFDAAALTSLSMGDSDYQSQSSAFAATTPLMNVAIVPNPLRSYLLDSATISPPASTGLDH
ncbi:hypothetical protein Tcan_00976, partial [Toxocara canis]